MLPFIFHINLVLILENSINSTTHKLLACDCYRFVASPFPVTSQHRKPIHPPVSWCPRHASAFDWVTSWSVIAWSRHSTNDYQKLWRNTWCCGRQCCLLWVLLHCFFSVFVCVAKKSSDGLQKATATPSGKQLRFGNQQDNFQLEAFAFRRIT